MQTIRRLELPPMRRLLPSTAARRWPRALARRAFPPATFLGGDRFPLGSSRNVASDEVKDDDSGRPADMIASANYLGMRSTTSGSSSPATARLQKPKSRASPVTTTTRKKNSSAGTCSWLGTTPWTVYSLSTYVFPRTRHRDGSIYKNRNSWTRRYRGETLFEAMMFTEPTKNCFIFKGICIWHPPGHILQILSIKVAKIHMDGGPVALYGYIAVRDNVDPLLNYIVKFSRDDPIIVEQGSFINLAGPKRGIDFCDGTLIEYDVRIKTAEEEKHDLQLIDGVSMVHRMGLQNCQPFKKRIHGDSGAVDITAPLLEQAVEATVEVGLSEVQGSFNLSLGCFTSGMNEEIQLFDGAIIGETLCLKRFVVAVELDSWIRLKLKVGSESSSSAEHGCSFYAGSHGFNARKILRLIWR